MKTFFLPLLFLLLILGGCYKEEPDDNTNPQLSPLFAISNFEAKDAILELDLILGLQNESPSAYNLSSKIISPSKIWDLRNGYSFVNGRAVTCQKGSNNTVHIVDILDSTIVNSFSAKVGQLLRFRIGGNFIATIESDSLNKYIAIYDLKTRNLLSTTAIIAINTYNFYISHDGKKVIIAFWNLGRYFCDGFNILDNGATKKLNTTDTEVSGLFATGPLLFNSSANIIVDNDGRIYDNLFKFIGQIDKELPNVNTKFWWYYVSSNSPKIHAFNEQTVTSFSYNDFNDYIVTKLHYDDFEISVQNIEGMSWKERDWAIITLKNKSDSSSTIIQKL